MQSLHRGLAAVAACALGAAALVAVPTAAIAAEPGIRINEVVSKGGSPDDWIEFYNPTAEPFVLDGYVVKDSDDDHVYEFPVDSIVEPGGFFVIDTVDGGVGDFDFGLGGGDSVRLFDPSETLVEEFTWTAHGNPSWGRTDAGEWAETSAVTKGAANTFPAVDDGGDEGPGDEGSGDDGSAGDGEAPAVSINEIESNGGTPGDWVEIINHGSVAVDISGWTVMDADDVKHAADVKPLPAGTILEPGALFVFDELITDDGKWEFDFGLGSNDKVTLRDAHGATVDEHAWTSHARVTLARCPDGTGDFVDAPTSTKGLRNDCTDTGDGEEDTDTYPVGEWPGAADVRVVDETPTFLEDSSGLDVQVIDEGVFLWAVDNGTGTFWKLEAHANGDVTFADGWETGKRARFQKDADDPRAAGPDAEGITLDANGWVYIASERDNNAKGVNQNVVLKVNPDAPGPDVVATQEWDLTEQLPAVSANLGIEAVEWVSDAVLAGRIIDQNTNEPYAPSTYPLHGGGLFFVAVEDEGQLFAFALNSDGTAVQVASFDVGLAGVMALDYDAVLGVLWAVCDDGCLGKAAQLTFNGTDTPGVAHVARPAGMPNLNNEGFATAPASLSVDGQRPVWWFADGFTSASLRTGTLPATPVTDPGTGDGDTGGDGGTGTPGTGGGSGAGDAASGGTITPLPATDLTTGNRGGIDAPSSAPRGGTISITVGADHAGETVEVWMYSTPQWIGTATVDAAGKVSVKIPADAPLGAHRIAVYSSTGDLLGWADIAVTGQLPATGGQSPIGAIAVGGLLLVLGAALVALRRKTQRA